MMNNNINAIRTMERMNNIIEEMKQLQNELDALMNSNDLDSYENIPEEELDDLIDPEYKEAVNKEAVRKSYINTREYYWMVLIRQRLGIWLSYEEMKQFMDEAEDRSIDFSTKHPWSFTDDEIVEEFETFYRC